MSFLNYRVELDDEDYQKAYVEIAFLLDAFAATIDTIMGGNTAPVGRIAGRDTAARLPVYLTEPTLEHVVAALAHHMEAGFEFTLEGERISFGRCIVRQICEIRKIEPGTALCRLFHYYFDGIANGLLFRPFKSELVSAGETCTLTCCLQ